jgi:NADH-quinone oxidoreductase subunit E
MTNPSVVQDTRTPLPGQEADTEERLSEILSSYRGSEDELIPVLQAVQQAFGYLPEPAMKRIAEFLKLPESTVFGVSTFYAQFKLHPSGKNIVRVCRGTACHVRGGARILRQVEKELGIKPGETTPDFEYSLETVACFGACALAPVVVLNNNVSGRMTTTKVTGMLGKPGG